MNYFKVYTSDNARYVRDLAYRMMRDEQMVTPSKTESEFVIVVYTKEQFKKLGEKK